MHASLHPQKLKVEYNVLDQPLGITHDKPIRHYVLTIRDQNYYDIFELFTEERFFLVKENELIDSLYELVEEVLNSKDFMEVQNLINNFVEGLK